MQQRRLTDSHCGGRNPRRGFEIVNVCACFELMQTTPPHWRIVNPDGADVSDLIVLGTAGLLVASASRGEKKLKTHNICG
jgi:hypothetical protein